MVVAPPWVIGALTERSENGILFVSIGFEGMLGGAMGFLDLKGRKSVLIALSLI